MGSVDDLTFKVNFSADGVAKLRERVKDKLKEFMGDYTDDTLVEYVIVLLRNGRRKEEARSELNVFLGDDSTSFASWLWDHLASNLNLYVQEEEFPLEGATKLKPISGERSETNDSTHLNSESERGKSSQSSRSRHNREWKGMMRDAAEPPPLRSSVVDNVRFEEKRYRGGNRDRKFRSPAQHTTQKKRSRPDDRQHTKREVGQATIAAPRRLLQFAVRDAVGTSRPSIPDREPSLKRLRSVVSTSTGDSVLVDHPRRIKSIATVPNPMAPVIKAVAEAAEDVTRVKTPGSVFDRLGRGTHAPEIADQPAVGDADVEEEDYVNFDDMQGRNDPVDLHRHRYDRPYIEDMDLFGTETGLAFNSMSDDEHYNDVNIMDHSVTDVPRSVLSRGNKSEDPLVMQYSVAKNSNDMTQLARNKAEDHPVVPVNVYHKMANNPLNVNTWKAHSYQEKTEVTEMEERMAQENEPRNGKSGVQSVKDNSHLVAVGNGNVKPAAEAQKESQNVLLSAPGSYNAGRPAEDVDSRTIFVSNVHFAATKDGLSRHFNKFGEVLKVVVVTDAATGQPTGSAYVEFMRKEAADSALSLDGTSFMSRILKVVKRSNAQQDAAPIMTWPRIARGSPYTAPRFSRAPFPRGMPGVAFRPRLPVKPGARSLQWKRDAQSSPAESGATNSVISPTARSLTYVRTEPKSGTG